MRCPSCGNENPDDYTFCDECGARLTPQEGASEQAPPGPAQAPTAVQEVRYSPAGDGVGGPDDVPGGMGATNEAPTDASLGGPTPTCPNCGPPTVPGEAYC